MTNIILQLKDLCTFTQPENSNRGGFKHHTHEGYRPYAMFDEPDIYEQPKYLTTCDTPNIKENELICCRYTGKTRKYPYKVLVDYGRTSIIKSKDNSVLDIDYLFHYLNEHYSELNNFIKTGNELEEFKIIVPSIEKQRLLLTLLNETNNIISVANQSCDDSQSEIDRLKNDIHNVKKHIEDLSEQRKAIFSNQRIYDDDVVIKEFASSYIRNLNTICSDNKRIKMSSE